MAAGVAISPDGHRALVANYYDDSVSLLDLDRSAVIAEQDLRPGKTAAADAGKPGGEFPFAVVWSDAGHAWVSAPRDRQVVAVAIAPSSLRVAARIATLGEPTALLADPKSGRLFATEDNAGRLAIIDMSSGRLVACGAANQYIYQLEKGGLLEFPTPGDTALARTTLQVADNIGLPGGAPRA